MRGVAPLIYKHPGALGSAGRPLIYEVAIESAALPMESDRQGRAPRGPYFFFFLVAFFLATVSPPSVGIPPIANRVSARHAREVVKFCQDQKTTSRGRAGFLAQHV